MKVRCDFSRIQQTKWQEYAIRFVFGGLITAIAGYLSKKYGLSVGGLFLAFPAILPASVTLIEHHDGKKAAGADAMGAAIGSIGLLAFAAFVWKYAAQVAAWQVLTGGTIIWFSVSSALWLALQTLQHQKHY